MDPLKPTDQVVINLKVPYVAQKRTYSCWFASAKMLYLYRHPSSVGTKGFFKQELQKSEAGKGLIGLRNKSRVIAPTADKTYAQPSEGADDVGSSEQDWPLLKTSLGMREVDLKFVKWFNHFGPWYNRFDHAHPTKKVASKSADTIALRLRVMLETHGPLWAAGLFYQGGMSTTGHIIVVKGIMVREAGFPKKPTNYIIFNDPAANLGGGENCVKQFDWFLSRLFHPGTGENGTEGHSPLMYLPP